MYMNKILILAGMWPRGIRLGYGASRTYVIAILLLCHILFLAGIVSADSYVYANGQTIAKINESGVFYYHSDNIGSTSAITDQDGAVVEEQKNLPFGEIISGDEKYGFTSKEHDETGMQYFGLRFYNPTIGRFITVDPVKDGVNWYGYARNNPLKFIDPTGGKVNPILHDNAIRHILGPLYNVLPEKTRIVKASAVFERYYEEEIIGFLGSPESEEVLGYNPRDDEEKELNVLITKFMPGNKYGEIPLYWKVWDGGFIIQGGISFFNPLNHETPISFNVDALDLLDKTATMEDEHGRKREVPIAPYVLSFLFQDVQHQKDYHEGNVPLYKEIAEILNGQGECFVTKDRYIKWLTQKIILENKGHNAQQYLLWKMWNNKEFDEFTYRTHMRGVEKSRRSQIHDYQSQIDEVKKSNYEIYHLER